MVAELLAQRWSPQQISRHLRLKFPGEPGMRLCHESIYQAACQPGSPLLRPSQLAPHRRSPLRTGRDHRRAHQHAERRRPRFEQPMLTIHQRPFQPGDRSQTGHWEGDLIIGKDQGSAIGTLAERQTRMVRLLYLPQRDGDTAPGRAGLSAGNSRVGTSASGTPPQRGSALPGGTAPVPGGRSLDRRRCGGRPPGRSPPSGAKNTPKTHSTASKLSAGSPALVASPWRNSILARPSRAALARARSSSGAATSIPSTRPAAPTA
jgi:hypothetical protein